MNTMERLLHDEITRLMDRLAASVPDGGVERMRAVEPHTQAPARRDGHGPGGPPERRWSKATAAGGGRSTISRTCGRSPRGGQPRPKRRRRKPPPSRPEARAPRRTRGGLASKRCQ